MSRILRIGGAAAVATGLAVTGLAVPAVAAPAHPAVHVQAAAKPKPSLSVTTNHHVYKYGSKATFTAHLGKTRGDNRVVTLTVHQAGSKIRVVRKGKVGPKGTISATVRVTRDTIFGARYDGDLKDARTASRAKRSVRVHIKTVLHNSYANRGRVHLVHKGKNANYAAEVIPLKPGKFVHFKLEGKAGGRWQFVDSKPIKLNKKSVGGVTFNEPTGYTYRIHVTYKTDKTNFQLTSPWTYVRFV